MNGANPLWQAQAGRQVHKFGGSSLADSNCFRKVAKLVTKYSLPGDLVVVSAAGKTTNRLIECIALAGQAQRHDALEQLRQFQANLLSELLDEPMQTALTSALNNECAVLARRLASQPDRHQEAEILGHGEIWSARLLAALLQQQGEASQWMDARNIFIAGDSPQPAIDIARSTSRLAPYLAEFSQQRMIVTGFVALNEALKSVTLGRNGSDYSASVLAVLADAHQLTIWTDVAGVYSADPNKVSGAHVLPLLSVAEADEMARLGSPVLHARTLQPLYGRKTRACVRSTFSPDGSLTQIIPGKVGEKGAKTVTYLNQVCLISLTTQPDSEFDEVKAALETCLAEHQLLPLCREFRPDQRWVRFCFTPEVANEAFTQLSALQTQGRFNALTLTENYRMVAMVGDGVSDNPFHHHSFYRQLEHAPVEFIETGPQGGSLVAVMRETDLAGIVARLHHGFAKPEKRTGVVLFGTGEIGSAWLSLFEQQRSRLSNHYNMDVILCGLVNKSACLVDFDGVEIEGWQQAFDDHAQPLNMDALTHMLGSHPYDEMIVVDATASSRIGGYYPELFSAGFHIISANKWPVSAPLSQYLEIQQSRQERKRHWLHNATLASAMPLTETLQSLLQAGDQVGRITGAFSATWSWLLQQYQGQGSFTALLHQARQQGLAEPDPRDDLSGDDVKRKLLILARQLGMTIELDEIETESLLPHGWDTMPLEACLEEPELLDKTMELRYQAAAQKGKKLAYVAELDMQQGIRASLQEVDAGHDLSQLEGGENAYALTTQWYPHSPLRLRGSGAGRTLAAGGIQMDLFRLCGMLR